MLVALQVWFSRTQQLATDSSIPKTSRSEVIWSSWKVSARRLSSEGLSSVRWQSTRYHLPVKVWKP